MIGVECEQCQQLSKKLEQAEQAINLMAPSVDGEIIQLRCQILEIRMMLTKFTQGRYAILADGMAVGRLYGAYYEIKAGHCPKGEQREALITLLEAMGIIDLRL
jgi:hypothetical protein